MSQDSKSGRERVLRFMLNNISQLTNAIDRDERDKEDDDESRDRPDFSAARELIGTMASWAGKGKDEIVQTLCREIGQAVAAVVKEPLTQVLEERKLRVTIELVPRNDNTQQRQTPRKKIRRQPRRPS